MPGKSDTIGVNAKALASRQLQTDMQRTFQEILRDLLCVLNLKGQMCCPDDTCRVETETGAHSQPLALRKNKEYSLIGWDIFLMVKKEVLAPG